MTSRIPSAKGRDATASDAETLRAIAAGDLGALGLLFDRHHAAVRRYATRAARTPSEADDIAQETFLTVPGVAASYDGRASARPWLLGIATQLLKRRRRSVARLARMLGELAMVATRRVRTPEELATDAANSAALAQAFERLSEEKRTVFLLVEGEGLSGEEVAIALGIPTATVWTRLHYARKALRASLKGRRE